MFEIFNNPTFWNAIKGNTLYHELTPREIKILKCRIIKKMTLKKTGQEFEVATERVRQIEAKALEKIRKSFKINNK